MAARVDFRMQSGALGCCRNSLYSSDQKGFSQNASEKVLMEGVGASRTYCLTTASGTRQRQMCFMGARLAEAQAKVGTSMKNIGLGGVRGSQCLKGPLFLFIVVVRAASVRVPGSGLQGKMSGVNGQASGSACECLAK